MKADKMVTGFSLIQVDIGEKVYCDICNGDYSISDKQGGLLLGSYGVCPECVPGIEKDCQESGEEWAIKMRCPEGMSFRDWILGIR